MLAAKALDRSAAYMLSVFLVDRSCQYCLSLEEEEEGGFSVRMRTWAQREGGKEGGEVLWWGALTCQEPAAGAR